MKRLRTHLIGVDTGTLMLFSHFQEDGEMWAGKGPREVRRHIAFKAPFHSRPAVQVGMTMLDLDQQTNPRLDLTAENITRKGFDVVFKTWSDTRVARVRADWMAIGEAPGEDDWDID